MISNPIEGEAVVVIFGLKISSEAIFFDLVIETDNL